MLIADEIIFRHIIYTKTNKETNLLGVLATTTTPLLLERPWHGARFPERFEKRATWKSSTRYLMEFLRPNCNKVKSRRFHEQTAVAALFRVGCIARRRRRRRRLTPPAEGAKRSAARLRGTWRDYLLYVNSTQEWNQSTMWLKCTHIKEGTHILMLDAGKIFFSGNATYKKWSDFWDITYV